MKTKCHLRHAVVNDIAVDNVCGCINSRVLGFLDALFDKKQKSNQAKINFCFVLFRLCVTFA